VTTTAQRPTDQTRVVWYRNVRVLRVVVQVLFVVAVFGLFFWLFNNLVNNLNRLRIGTDFSFLSRPTRFQIPHDEGFDPSNPVWQMVLVGVKNTMLAGFFGILLATVLGVLIGVARLSTNWLVARLAAVYVETLRNIPPLIIIIFFGFAVFTFGPFPVLSEAYQLQIPGTDKTGLILSNTVWAVPSFVAGPRLGLFWLVIALGAAAAAAVFVWRTRLHERTGVPDRRMRWSLGVLGGITLAAILFIGDGFDISYPALAESGRRIVGGFRLNNGFISVTVALGLYTASHIAEIVRGSILAVPKGQSEAANAIALTGFQRYRFVLLPQAMRIAVPPIISQYLNLVKNTSLGVVVAYAEITRTHADLDRQWAPRTPVDPGAHGGLPHLLAHHLVPAQHLQPPPPVGGAMTVDATPLHGVITSPGEWVRKRLFNSVLNSVLTVVLIPVVLYLVWRGATFLFVTARWEPVYNNLTLWMVGRYPRAELWRVVAQVVIWSSALGLAWGAAVAGAKARALRAGLPYKEDGALAKARRYGAILGVVALLLAMTRTWGPLIMFATSVALAVALQRFAARTPAPQVAYLWAGVAVLAVAGFQIVSGFYGTGWLWMGLPIAMAASQYLGGREWPTPRARQLARLGVTIAILAIAFVAYAIVDSPGIGWERWEGLRLNVLAAPIAIVLAFPIGMGLALARRSSFPALRLISTGYIELIRGVPLISLLLMGHLFIGFFLDASAPLSPLTRAFIVLTMFASAYIAEIIRGGLQSVPKGQIEAGQSVGLSAWKVTRLIVLPQALRNGDPGDGGPVHRPVQGHNAAVHHLDRRDPVRVAVIVHAQAEFRGFGIAETLVFVALVFWAITYSMSRESQRLERQARSWREMTGSAPANSTFSDATAVAGSGEVIIDITGSTSSSGTSRPSRTSTWPSASRRWWSSSAPQARASRR
jgi:His/Glu/Gln/Arg/opine family amino acid ABC transporter permease subunit